MPTILVTGGAGYIGTHTCVELLTAGYEVVVVDNLLNSDAEALRRVRAITGRDLAFAAIDLLDKGGLERVFAAHRVDGVIHFAGLKAVGESVQQPLRYYHNNLTGTLNLLQVMQDRGVKRLVFSSSATVYGDPKSVPIREDFPPGATNPYGRTKQMIEEMCRDLAIADKDWRIALLRYFNPIGAHPSGRIGEDPVGIPNNLMPFLLQVAVGKRPKLSVYGNDWPTKDGTGVRDYIHVVDLALGHLAAVRKLDSQPGCVSYNLGTGQGYSVLELVQALSKAVGRDLPYEIVARRPGDIGVCYADPAFAAKELGWRATRGVDEMCADGWRWQQGNPNGYR